MKERAVSPVLGIVLLLGLTTVAATSMLLLTSVLIGETQSAAEVQQAEQSLSSLAQSADQIAHGEIDEATFDLHGDDEASVSVDDQAGSYEVRIERDASSEVLTSGSLGVYRYETEETTLAFQGGGVWRQDATGGSQLVRAPQFHYRSQPDPTLTLPVVRFDGEQSEAATAGTLEIAEKRDVYPTRPHHENPLHDGVVYVDVESEFCEGWELFFATRTDGAVVERCSDDDQTNEGEIQVMLSVPFTFGGLGSDTAVARTISGNGDVYGSTSEGAHTMESVSGVVEHKVEACADGMGESLGTDVSGGGLYCERDDMDASTYTIDPEGDDVEIAVEGRFEPDDLEIVGDGTVTVFAKGHVLPMPGNDIGDTSNPDSLRIVVHSDHDVGELPAGGGAGAGGPGGGQMHVYGLLYAPNSEVGFAGNVDVHGGVVADHIHLQSSSTKVWPVASVLDVELEFDRGGEPFYYLHVTETTLRVRG